MLLKVNPNRMELLKLKKKLIIAKRGYKLLKDKRDALIQKYIQLVKEDKIIREKVEEKLMKGYSNFSSAIMRIKEIIRA